MEYVSTQKYLRLSPKKVREIALLVKKLTPLRAIEILPFINKKGSLPLEKVIKTAIANAKQQGVTEDDLVIKDIQVMEGPRLKRGLAVSRGRWHPIKKRMSHIRVVLTAKTDSKKNISKPALKPEKQIAPIERRSYGTKN